MQYARDKTTVFGQWCQSLDVGIDQCLRLLWLAPESDPCVLHSLVPSEQRSSETPGTLERDAINFIYESNRHRSIAEELNAVGMNDFVARGFNPGKNDRKNSPERFLKRIHILHRNKFRCYNIGRAYGTGIYLNSCGGSVLCGSFSITIPGIV